MGKRHRPGSGAIERKRVAAEAKYVKRQVEIGVVDECRFHLQRGRPRRLSVSHEVDRQFEVDFTTNVLRELQCVQEYQARYQTDETLPVDTPCRSCYDFFGKSTLLVEALCPAREGTPHLFVELGVAGSGKSALLSDFLMDVYSGKYATITGPAPSILLSSAANERVLELCTLVSSVRYDMVAVVPQVHWCGR